MVGNAPSGAQIDAGERLLTELPELGVPVYAAAWLFDEDRERWLLNLVSDWYAGPLERPYQVLVHILRDAGGAVLSYPPLDSDEVVPVRRDSDLGRALMGLAPLARVTPRPVSNQYLSGVFIPEAVLYKVAA